jgi:hypothetical protein
MLVKPSMFDLVKVQSMFDLVKVQSLTIIKPVLVMHMVPLSDGL